jgi:hypothetical protein
MAPNYFPAAPFSPPNGSLPDVKEESDALSASETVVESDPRIIAQVNGLKRSILFDDQRREAERKEAESISRLDELLR